MGIALVAGVALGCGPAPIEVALVAPDPLLNGLVAHWPLDDSAGTATDHSGNGHDGTLAAGTWITGNFGGALHFDSGNAVSVPSFPDASASWSVALWARPSSPASGNNLWYTLISTENVFKGGWEMNIRLDPASNIYYEFAYWIGPGQSDYALVRCTCVVFDQWTHLAAVRDGPGGTLSLYVNGVLQSTMPQAPATTALPLILPGSPTLFLGRWLGDARLYVGDLDDVAVYNRSLVASEVMRLTTSAVPESPK